MMHNLVLWRYEILRTFNVFIAHECFIFFRRAYDSEASCDGPRRRPYCTCDIVVDLLEAYQYNRKGDG